MEISKNIEGFEEPGNDLNTLIEFTQFQQELSEARNKERPSKFSESQIEKW